MKVTMRCVKCDAVFRRESYTGTIIPCPKCGGQVKHSMIHQKRRYEVAQKQLRGEK